MKTCSHCHSNKDDLEFHKNKHEKDGFQYWCRECVNSWGRLHSQGIYQKHKARLLIYNDRLIVRFKAYSNRAKRKKQDWQLSIEEFQKLTSKACHYCGQFTKNKNYSGIDRINSQLGYILTNCVSCCKRCNRMKMDDTEKEFFYNIQEIYNYRVKDILEED